MKKFDQNKMDQNQKKVNQRMRKKLKEQNQLMDEYKENQKEDVKRKGPRGRRRVVK